MKRILNAAAIFFLAAVYCRAESQHAKVALEISGTIDRFFYRKSRLTNESLLFKMVVSGERWQIATTPAPQSSAYSETTCDGTNIFHFNKTNILSFDSKTRGLPRNCYWCRIDPGIIPSGGYSVQIPWLAYASSTLAQVSLINIPAPWIDPRYYPRAHAYEAQVEAFTNPPYLPQSVNFRCHACVLMRLARTLCWTGKTTRLIHNGSQRKRMDLLGQLTRFLLLQIFMV
jgi:hypothetical protein